MIRPMFISPTDALNILEHYKYLLIFPIAVIEGPIIIIISGFLIYQGYLNALTAYVILVIADTMGDLLYYSIGRFWRRLQWLKKYARWLGYSEKSEAFLEGHFKNHKGKTFLLAKVSHGIGGAVQISAGIAKVDIKVFLMYSLAGTLVKTYLLLLVGFHVGNSYIKIDGIFNRIALITFITVSSVIIFYVFISKYAKRYFHED